VYSVSLNNSHSIISVETAE